MTKKFFFNLLIIKYCTAYIFPRISDLCWSKQQICRKLLFGIIAKTNPNLRTSSSFNRTFCSEYSKVNIFSKYIYQFPDILNWASANCNLRFLNEKVIEEMFTYKYKMHLQNFSYINSQHVIYVFIASAYIQIKLTCCDFPLNLMKVKAITSWKLFKFFG